MGAKPTSETVLYVEDEECDRMFMEAAFRKAGMGEALRTVEDGREAIEYLKGSGACGGSDERPAPAVVLLDLNLPVIGGFEVLKWMRSRPELAALAVVVFSSSPKEADKVKALELGANEFVEKPGSGLRFGEVVERVRARWLSQGRASSAE